MQTEINGKPVDLRLDLGAVKLFNEKTGKNLLTMQADGWGDIDVLAALMYACAIRSNKEITEEDIDTVDLGFLMTTMTTLVEGSMPKLKGKADPLAATAGNKRQK